MAKRAELLLVAASLGQRAILQRNLAMNGRAGTALVIAAAHPRPCAVLAAPMPARLANALILTAGPARTRRR